MAGIQIPLGGDLGPLLEAFAQIRGQVRRLSQQVDLALRPVRSTFAATFGAARMSATVAFRAITGTARAAANTIRASFSGLKNLIPGGGMVGGLVGVAGAAGAIALAISQFKSGSDIASNFERARIALTSLTGSGEQADRVLAEMRDTWQRTGVTVADQTRTIQKFLALGFSSDDALKLQRNILDIAGAVGMSAEEAELLGSALAQVQAKGTVSMEELRQQIAEKGIPVFDALAAKLGVTQAALIEMVSAGKVPAQQLIDIFLNMEGTFARFRGGAEKLGMTFGGMIARLRGAWQLLLADFAAPINAALKPLLQQATEMIQGMRQRAVEMGQAVGNSLLAAFALFRSGKTVELLATGLKIAMAGATEVLTRGLRSAVAFLAAALPPVFSAAVATIKDPVFWAGVGNLLRGIGMGIAAEIAAISPRRADKQKADMLRNSAELASGVGRNQIAGSGRGIDFAEVLVKSLLEGAAAAKREASRPAGAGMRDALDSWRDLAATVAKEMEALRKKTALPADPAAAPAATAGVVSSLAAAAGQIMTLASSTARIGGGGFGMTLTPMVSEQKKTNGLLTKLVEQGKTRNVATYA